MFDSSLFEVIIGLFFVYLLLSLLATALNELVMTYMNARGKGLLMGVQKLLDDSKARQRLSHFIFHSPQFKKLYRPGSKRIPSYLSSSRFVEIFLFAIHERHITSGLIGEVLILFDDFCKGEYGSEEGYAERAKSSDLSNVIERIKTQLEQLDAIGEDETKWQVKAKSWFLDSVKGMFRRAEVDTIASQREKILAEIEKLYMELAGKRDGASGHWNNIDEILKKLEQGKQRLWDIKTAPISIEDVRAAVGALHEGDTKALLSAVLRESGHSLQSFKFQLEKWYNEIMDRASAWYKRKVQIALLIIGLGVSVSFNADSFSIVKTLSADPEARMQLVQMATQYIESNQAGPPGIASAGQDTSAVAGTPPTERDTDRIATIQRQIDGLVDEQIQRVDDLLGLGWDNWDVEYRSYALNDAAYVKLAQQEVPSGVIDVLESIPDLSTFKYAAFREELSGVLSSSQRQAYENVILDAAKTDVSWWEEFKNRISYGWPRIWGWLVTSIAISLGAPFWFDLLKKIIHLRGTGQRPAKSASGHAPVG